MDVDLEFRDLIKVEGGDSGDPLIIDCMHPRPMSCQSDDLEKFFEAGHAEQSLQKNARDWRTEFLRSISRKPEPKNEPEEESCEAFYDCEKRASSRSTVKLTKRLCPETDEIMVEHWNSEGECISTTFVPAGAEISEGEPLAKASITSSMLKTLAQIRAALTPEEFEAASKAVKALDVDAFLQICRRAQVTA